MVGGTDWLANPERWPAEMLTEPSNETEAEAKLIKEVFATAVETKDDLDDIEQKQLLEDNSSDGMDHAIYWQLQAEEIRTIRGAL